MYIEVDNEDKETIVNAFIQYFIRLNIILEYFKKDIPQDIWKIINEIISKATNDDKEIQKHALEVVGNTLFLKDKATLIHIFIIELRTKKRLDVLRERSQDIDTLKVETIEYMKFISSKFNLLSAIEDTENISTEDVIHIIVNEKVIYDNVVSKNIVPDVTELK